MPARTECPDFNVDPAIDKGIMFVNGVCPMTDDRLLWDYNQAILDVDGKISSSGTIATSADLEGSFLSALALGTGSFNFTPPSGYGGLVYRGGAQWYYWDNSLNAWELTDFSTHVTNDVSIIAGPGLIGGGPLTGNVTLAVDPNYGFVDIFHNGSLVGNRPILNFTDSVSVSWGISSNGNVAITAFGTGGGAWIADVNANGHSILNLNQINGIPITSFLTNPFNRDVLANNFNLTQIGNAGVNGNLTVGGEFIYQGVPIEDLLAGGGLWSLASDGSIFRNSDVVITGGNAPLTVNTTGASNFLYLNTPATTGAWNALAVEFSGVYFGELGWGQTSLELWTRNNLAFRAIDLGNIVFFPGVVGIGTQTPNQALQVIGNINASNCFMVNGVSAMCNNGAGGTALTVSTINATNDINSNTRFLLNGIPFTSLGNGVVNLNNIGTINGSGSFVQTPWVQNINGNGFQLTGAAALQATTLSAGSGGVQSVGNVNTQSCYLIGGITFACASAGQVNLTNVATINGTPPGTGSGGSYNGPTNGPNPSGPRQLNLNFQNNTGRPIWVSVGIQFPQGTGGSVGAYVGYTSPASVLAAYVDTGSGVTGGVYQINFVVLPGMWYEVFDISGQVGVDIWSEWW